MKLTIALRLAGALHLLIGRSTAFQSSMIGTTSCPCHRHRNMKLCSSATSSSTSSLNDLVNGQVAWNAVVGEADRAFRHGLQLEKSGQPRSATGAFSEAATLYQCFLELPKNFEHVTNLSQEDCAIALSYSLVRLGHLNINALGDPRAAIKLYTMASEIDPQPSLVA